MASLRKLPNSPYWIACFTTSDNTRTNRSTKTTDKRAAMQIALEWERASKDAQKGNLVESQARKVVNDILERVGAETIKSEKVKIFLDQWASGKNNEATAQRYQQIVAHFTSHLGNKENANLTAISHKDILSFVESRRAAGVAPKTASVEAKILNAAFNLARRLGFIMENPVEKALALKPIKVQSSKKECFTPEQVSELLKTAKGDWLTLTYLAFYTGARLRDCANMKWSDVNFMNGVMDFLPQKTGANAKRVVIPIHVALQAHLEKIATDKPEAYLCPSLVGKETGGEHGLSKSFNRIMQQAGVDAKMEKGKGNRKFSKLSFHSFRHSFNSILANEGVDQETRMVLTGHTSVEINKDYTKIDLPKLKAAIGKLPPVG